MGPMGIISFYFSYLVLFNVLSFLSIKIKMSTFHKKNDMVGDENKCYIGTSFSEMNSKSAVLICIFACTDI